MSLDHCEPGMRKFVMKRNNDVSGVSGTGTVLEGIELSTGLCIVHWLSPAPRGSISIFDKFDDFLAVHVKSHAENKTEIHWFKLEQEEEKVELI